GGYVFLVLARALAYASEPLTLLSTISPTRQAVVVAVALCAMLLGFVPLRPFELLQIGRPDMAIGGPRWSLCLRACRSWKAPNLCSSLPGRAPSPCFWPVCRGESELSCLPSGRPRRCPPWSGYCWPPLARPWSCRSRHFA